ncbi:MAG: family lipase, partial [Paenibacillus sp.]|nr:family lipase [Paenibacillus sp.]
MQPIPLDSSLFRGAVSLEPKEGGGLKPWRIPYKQVLLFPPNGINKTPESSAGVRLQFVSDTTAVRVEVAPYANPVKFDLVIGDSLQTTVLQPGESAFGFEGLAGQSKQIEMFLPQGAEVTVKSISIDDGASWSAPADTRLKWITYGSSITQCGAAFSPAQTWPALVARRFGLDLTCLGFSGNCHLEPMVARLIRDLPADVISLCLGINVYGNGSLNKRTFQAAVVGFVQLIREKHPDTPLVLMSPIWSPPREDKKNVVDFTLKEMRLEIEEAFAN